jgi:hypothetical protein
MLLRSSAIALRHGRARSGRSYCLAGRAVTVALQMTRCSASPPAAIGMLSMVPTIRARAPLGCSTSIQRP